MQVFRLIQQAKDTTSLCRKRSNFRAKWRKRTQLGLNLLIRNFLAVGTAEEAS